MSETDAIEEAGRWYRDVLVAVGDALSATTGVPANAKAARLVQVLAQQGWTIERERLDSE